MHPILLASPRVGAYGVLLLVGMGVGWWVARLRSPAAGIPRVHVDVLVPLTVGAGLAGSVVAGWVDGVAATHGRVLYGALLAGVAAAIGYAAWMRLPLGRLGDAVAPSLAIGVGIGRVGCFLAGCCWGDVCVAGDRLRSLAAATREQVHTVAWLSPPGWPLAVRFPAESFAQRQHLSLGLVPPRAPSLAVHPVQLYEATLLAAVFLLLCWHFRRPRVWGETFLLLAMGYAAIRLLLEPLRADNAAVVGPFTFSQLVAIGSLVLCVSLWLVRRRCAPRWGLVAMGEVAGRRPMPE